MALLNRQPGHLTIYGIAGILVAVAGLLAGVFLHSPEFVVFSLLAGLTVFWVGTCERRDDLDRDTSSAPDIEQPQK